MTRRRMMLEHKPKLVQAVKPEYLRATFTENGITFTNNRDGSFTLNGTATALTAEWLVSTTRFYNKANYYGAIIGAPDGSSRTYCFYDGLTIGDGGENKYYFSTVLYTIYILVKNGTSFNNTIIWPMLVDLTATYGAGNEPTTIEQLRQDYPDNYYPYYVPTT